MLLSLAVITSKNHVVYGAYFYFFGPIGRKVKHGKIM